jgi:hypothetical protein
MMIGNSANNYWIMDEESHGGSVFPPGITSSWTRNPMAELPAHERGIYPRNIFLPGITSSWTKNPREELLFHQELL